MKNNNKRNNIVYSEKVKFKQMMRFLALGIIGSVMFSFNALAQLAVTVNNPTTCVCASILSNCSGGTPPYTYSWSTGENSQNISPCPVASTSYTLTVTDANSLTQTAVSFVTYNGVDASFTVSPGKTVCVGTVVNFTYTGAIGINNNPLVDTIMSPWYTSFQKQRAWTRNFSVNYSVAGTYVVYHVIQTSTGCMISVSDSIRVKNCDVWPGDADYSGLANNNDILAIGIGYGSSGTVRSGGSINWVSQPATDWGTTLSNGTDYKHVDCNGDGTINATDTTAVKQNYGLTHALKLAKPEYINGLPDVSFTIPVDTALSGSTITVPVTLGSSTNQANSIYGLAFSITYDPKIVDTTKLSLSLTGSWLGTNGTDLIYITKIFGSIGRLDVGITRIDHTNVSGFGKIGDLSITMRDDMQLKAASTIYKTLTLDAVQIKAISKDETIVALNAVSNSVVVKQDATTGVNNYSQSNSVNIYPNPASGLINVAINATDVREVQLINIIGETVWQQTNTIGNKIVIDAQTLPAGTYYLSVTTSQDRIVKQVNVIK